MRIQTQKIIDRVCWLDIAKFFIIDTLVLEKTAVYKIEILLLL